MQKIIINLIFSIFLILSISSVKLAFAATQAIQVDQLDGYADYPTKTQALIKKAAKLSQLHLSYQFGSDSPKNKGMDCSGTIYYLLNGHQSSRIPRDAQGLFYWIKKHGYLHTISNNHLNSSDFSSLKPGDLLFWSGTYHSSKWITHVMMYLGKNKHGKPLMFGSSNGRTYNGKRMWGVSVFDFQLPSGRGRQHFVGYGHIPGI